MGYSTNSTNFTNQMTTPIISLTTDQIIQEKVSNKNLLKKALFGDGFEILNKSEKIVLLKEYFQLKDEIWLNKQRKVMASYSLHQIEEEEKVLYSEQLEQEQEIQLLFRFSTNMSTFYHASVSEEEKEEIKTGLTEVFQYYQNSIASSKSLKSLLETQRNTLNAKEVSILQKFVGQSIAEGDMVSTLSLSKELFAKTGETRYAENIDQLLQNEQKAYLYWEDRVIELSNELIVERTGEYIHQTDIRNIPNFIVNSSETQLTLTNNNNTVTFDKITNETLLNGERIADNLLKEINGSTYLPLQTVIDLFHYTVSKENEILHIRENVFVSRELNTLEPSILINMLLNQ